MNFRSNLMPYPLKFIISAIAILTAGIIMYFSISQILINDMEKSLIEIAEQGAKIVESEINGSLNVLEGLSSYYELNGDHATEGQKFDFLTKEAKRNGFKRISIADTYGNSKTTDGKIINVSDRSYFIKASLGSRNVSEPLSSRVDGTLSIVFAVPLYSGGKVTGVLYATREADVLCNITDNIKLGENGNSFIINKDGIIIAHDNRKLVYNMYNILKEVEKDSSLVKLAELEKKMIQGKSGTGEYYFDEMNKYLAYAPIPGTDWSIAVSAPKQQIFKTIGEILSVFFFSAVLVSLLILGMNFRTYLLRKKIAEEQAIINKAVDTANLIIIHIDHNGLVTYFNKYAEEKTGYLKDDVLQVKNIFEMIPEKEQLTLRQLIRSSGEKTNLQSLEFSLEGKNGELLYILWDIELCVNKNSCKIELMGIDITQRVEAENKLIAKHKELSSLYEEITLSEEELRQRYQELSITQEKLLKSEERYQLALEGSNDSIWDWNSTDNKIFYSDKFYEIFEYGKGEIGDSFGDLVNLYHPEDVIYAKNANTDFFSGITPTLKYECRIITKRGDYKWVLIRGMSIRDENGNVIRMAGSLTDITERKVNEQIIRQLAYYDPLTSLPNRITLYERANTVIKNAIISNTKGALVFIDLDNFKYINDSFGHSLGDLLLVEIGSRLSNTLGNNCMVSRLGGDEFIILIEKIQDNDLINNANKLMEVFSTPYLIESNSFYVSVSVGISVFPDDSSDVESLLKNADTAMYYAKKTGKRKYIFFDKSMNDAVVEKMDIESKLRKALSNDEFALHYQAQIDLITGRVYGFEALIRWISPEFGFVPPSKFIDIAEDSGLIVPIGEWVLKTACKFNKHMHQQGYTDLNISVNISVLQFVRDEFEETILRTLEETGLEAKYLEIELTESILMEGIDVNLRKLENLRQKGIKILLDDFGKGYSSLSYLKQLPINTLKIDKSFIDDIGNNKDITDSIVQIAHKMGLNVIAEGVETREQLDYLIQSRCNIVQGYYFSKPLPETDAIKLLDTGKMI